MISELLELVWGLVGGVLILVGAAIAVVVLVFLLPFTGVIREAGAKETRRLHVRPLDVIG